MQRVLVTGGAGFVGANLVRRLLAEGVEVHLFLRPTTDRWRLHEVLPELRVHPGALTDRSAVDRAFAAARPTHTFHLAAHGMSAWQQDVEEIVRTNIIGTQYLLEAAAHAGVERFVLAGSSSEYGFKPHACAETELPAPNSLYAVSKLGATHLAQLAAGRVPTVVARLYSAYGPFEEPRRLIPTLITHGLEGRWPPLVSRRVARDFIHIEDIVGGLLAAARRPVPPGAVFNLGSGQMTTVEELVALVGDLLGVPVAPDWGSMPERAWDTDFWLADVSHARRVLEWQPGIALRPGIQQCIAWLRAHPALGERYRRVERD